MTYSVHAAGSGGYGYAKSNQRYGGEWDYSFLERKLLAAATKPLTRGRMASPTAVPTAVMVNILGNIERLRILIDTFDLMKTRRGIVNLYIRHTRVLLPDQGANIRFYISPSGLSSRHARRLFRSLEHNDMNYWSPLIDIIEILNEYLLHLHEGYLLNITLHD